MAGFLLPLRAGAVMDQPPNRHGWEFTAWVQYEGVHIYYSTFIGTVESMNDPALLDKRCAQAWRVVINCLSDRL